MSHHSRTTPLVAVLLASCGALAACSTTSETPVASQSETPVQPSASPSSEASASSSASPSASTPIETASPTASEDTPDDSTEGVSTEPDDEPSADSRCSEFDDTDWEFTHVGGPEETPFAPTPQGGELPDGRHPVVFQSTDLYVDEMTFDVVQFIPDDGEREAALDAGTPTVGDTYPAVLAKAEEQEQWIGTYPDWLFFNGSTNLRTLPLADDVGFGDSTLTFWEEYREDTDDFGWGTDYREQTYRWCLSVYADSWRFGPSYVRVITVKDGVIHDIDQLHYALAG